MLFAVCLVFASSAAIAGAPDAWRYNKHGDELPFGRSGRAASVWDSNVCWNECGSYTTWNLVDCLYHDAQGRCLKYADGGDRACQRACRTRGGPFLPLDTLFPFEY
jgi:hypothetical protein